ncbi:hypothetical protein [Paragemmobacter straminiformis]|uniref:Flagellar protein FliT n=1 Tax=Paragemmobacter straminiformis TaxID=2045119 RepID=A0A842I6T8_9RHOB|nr:hypothetical protein [Gemmobacter straminiformis]MBC2834794.1 hypothetical protein [Gemmobacter straminiformis]
MTMIEGPAALGLAVIGGRLERAMSRSDMVEVLIVAAELDRMVRNLGPVASTDQDRAALVRAHDLVLRTLATLEDEMLRGAQDRRRDTRLRLAYNQTQAA